MQAFEKQWKPGFVVDVTASSDAQCKSWCIRNVERSHWAFEPYVTPETHRFMFQTKRNAIDFKTAFSELVEE
jgi:hypothetical protein